MKIEQFLSALSKLRFDNSFNPYSDICLMHDSTNSPKIRRLNLKYFLLSFPKNVRSMWVGRDLGYRGARRTGIPLTDEVHLQNLKTNCELTYFKKATTTNVMSERTATEIWSIINLLEEPPLLWNIFPLHPHKLGEQFSNRTHTSFERKACAHFIDDLVEMFEPEIIIAIGNDAFNALTEMNYNPIYVRHPSYGGKTEFVNGMNKIYKFDYADFKLRY